NAVLDKAPPTAALRPARVDLLEEPLPATLPRLPATVLWNKQAGSSVLNDKGDATFIVNSSITRTLAAVLTVSAPHGGLYDLLWVLCHECAAWPLSEAERIGGSL